MVKYKLIKDFPGCPLNVGEVVQNTNYEEYTTTPSNHIPIRFLSNQIENYPEFWEKIVEKDYEILEVRCISANGTLSEYVEIDGVYVVSKIDGDNLYLADFKEVSIFRGLNPSKSVDRDAYTGFEIYSVKRLSDGKVFTVEDKVEIGRNKNNTIDSFELCDYGIRVKVTRDYNCKKYGAKLSLVKQVPKPLFTTEDEVDKYLGDTCYYVTPVQYSLGFGRITEAAYRQALCRFHDKEKAKEYIEENKPQYSKKDILNLVNINDNNENLKCKLIDMLAK